jgi:hypothetical protein
MQLGFARFAELFYSLDSGLRRITSDLAAVFGQLSRMASSYTNDGVLNLVENQE